MGDEGARAALAEKARCSLGVAEGGGDQSASSSHVCGSPNSMRRHPGLGVGPAEGGNEGEPGGSRACPSARGCPGAGRPRPAMGSVGRFGLKGGRGDWRRPLNGPLGLGPRGGGAT